MEPARDLSDIHLQRASCVSKTRRIRARQLRAEKATAHGRMAARR
jgi:hypothetical protein